MTLNCWNVEVTDTFGGEANYCWVRRYTARLPAGASDRSILKAARAAASMTGVRARIDGGGDHFALYPYRQAVVMFVTWTDRDYAFDRLAAK